MSEMRLLLAGDTPVPLTSKAFDTLLVLIENRERVVTKDELLRSVWPDVEVEEGNLTQQIFLLRKALGESAQQPRHIVTIPGHGYRFTAAVTAISGDAAVPAVSSSGAAYQSRGRGSMFIATGVTAFGVLGLLAMLIAARSTPKEQAVLADVTRHITKITESGKATFSAISRDGRYIAYVENNGDQYSLWRKRVANDGRTQVVPPQPLALAHLSFSPDGEYIYFARRSASSPMFILSRVPAGGGAETPILEDVDSPVSFSPDGREFVFTRGADPESHIVVAAAGGGAQRILATRRFPIRFGLAADWSPDGQFVAAVEGDQGTESRSIVLLSLVGGTGRELYKANEGIGRLRWLADGSGLLAVISEGLERRQFGRVSGGAIWRIGYPDGRAERLTSDLANHDPCCLDVGANGSITSVVNTLVSDLRIAPAERLDALTQVSSDHPVVGRHSWLPDNDTMVYRDLSGRLNAVRKDERAASLQVPEGEEVEGGVSACGDGRYVVFSTTPGKNIWRVTPNAGNAFKLTSGFHDFNPACSSDGQWVLYASREPDHVSLWRVSIEGGTPTPFDLVDSYDVQPSPSGRMVYYSTDVDRSRNDQWVVISSSDRTRLFAGDGAGDAGIGVMTNWAPDESGLDYVVTRSGVSNIWRQPLAGGSPVQITHYSMGRIFSFAWSRDGRWLSLANGGIRSDVVLMSSQK